MKKGAVILHQLSEDGSDDFDQLRDEFSEYENRSYMSESAKSNPAIDLAF